MQTDTYRKLKEEFSDVDVVQVFTTDLNGRNISLQVNPNAGINPAIKTGLSACK